MTTNSADDRVMNLAEMAGANQNQTRAGLVVDATDDSFSQLVEISAQVPVIIDLWATWCEPCKQLSPILEKIVRELDGRVVLAKVDVDANPRIAQTFQVQSIPAVLAIIKGQAMALFDGAQPEAQVRAVFDEVLRLAASNGVNGRLDPEGSGEVTPPPPPPLHVEGSEALERGDLEGAERAFAQALRENPADDEAQAALAQIRLMRRVDEVDDTAASELLARADAAPTDAEAQLAAADLEMAGGQASQALDRLLALIVRLPGDEREPVRQRLVDYFAAMDPADPVVQAARRRLMSALF